MLDGRCPVDLDGNGTGVIRWWCSAAAARVGQGHARMVHAILAFRCAAGRCYWAHASRFAGISHQLCRRDIRYELIVTGCGPFVKRWLR